MNQKKPQPLFRSVKDLNAQTSLFRDPQRSEDDNTGPFVIVVDDFYPDPLAVRGLALSKPFFQYKPPLAEQVGEEVAASYADPRPVWLSTALLRYLGQKVRHPESGFRHATSEVRQALSDVVGESIDLKTWSETGDWWNGAFHLQFEAGNQVHRVVHHHFRDGDVTPRGWSGLVYLSPGAPAEYGTTIWREKRTKRCIAGIGDKYEQDLSHFDLALSIENRFNRLVLFRENVLHRAGHGFGSTLADARLIQTFFFQTNR
jgi:hypothetical protein